MFAPCINSIKTLFIVLTDAHCYKIIEMFKQFKIITLALTCFHSCRNHHQGAVLCLAKTTNMVFFVLVGIDAVSVMAAYQSVVQACGSACLHNSWNIKKCFSTEECLVSIMMMNLISKNRIWKKVLTYVPLTTSRMLHYSSKS